MATVRLYPLTFGQGTLRVPRGTEILGVLGAALITREPDSGRFTAISVDVVPTDGFVGDSTYRGSFQEGLFTWHVFAD